MLKRLILLFGVLLLGGIVGCQSPVSEATPTRPEPSATLVAETPTPQPTATPVASTPTPQPTATQPVAQASPLPEDTPAQTTKAASDRPVPTPAPPWQIPEVQPDDWATGGADAGMVLVEYSDFQ